MGCFRRGISVVWAVSMLPLSCAALSGLTGGDSTDSPPVSGAGANAGDASAADAKSDDAKPNDGRPDDAKPGDANVPTESGMADAGDAGTDAAPDAAAVDAALTYRARVLADQPLAYWRFGEASGLTARDESPNHNDAVYASSSGCTRGAVGAIANDNDTAVIFDGTTCDVSASESLDFPGRAPFTLEAWAKPRIYDSTYRMVFGKPWVNSDGYQQFGVFFRQAIGHGLVFERNVNDGQDVAAFANPQAGAFVHVVAVYDGSQMVLYVNGIGAGAAPDSRSQVYKPVPLHVGSNGLENYFDGVLDEVAVYGTALSAGTVLDHYSVGRGN